MITRMKKYLHFYISITSLKCQTEYDTFSGFYKDDTSKIMLEDGRRELLPSEETIFQGSSNALSWCGALLQNGNRIDWQNCNDQGTAKHYVCEYKGKLYYWIIRLKNTFYAVLHLFLTTF